MQWHFQAHIKSEAEKVPQCWLSVSLVDGSTMLAYSHTPQGSLITLVLYIPSISAVGRGNSLCLVLFKHAFLFKGSDVVLLFISSCSVLWPGESQAGSHMTTLGVSWSPSEIQHFG